MNEDVEQILSGSLTWERLLVTCQFCFDENGEPTRFWVTHNEFRCPACFMKGWVHDIPMVRLDGTVK